MDRKVRFPFQRDRVQSIQGGESCTDINHQEASDVNAIVARYHRSGELPPVRTPPNYADVTGLQGDLTERLQWAREHIDNAYKALSEVQQAQQNETGEPQTTNEPQTPETTTEPQANQQ